MKKSTYKIHNGVLIKQERDLKKKLNYNHLRLTNKTICCGELDLPEILCDLPVMPDYSIFGDIQTYENHHRMGRAREVALWLTMENNSIVIPNISAGSRRDL